MRVISINENINVLGYLVTRICSDIDKFVLWLPHLRHKQEYLKLDTGIFEEFLRR